jgi:hypothetical protein
LLTPPPWTDVKAILLPSGDQTGSKLADVLVDTSKVSRASVALCSVSENRWLRSRPTANADLHARAESHLCAELPLLSGNAVV